MKTSRRGFFGALIALPAAIKAVEAAPVAKEPLFTVDPVGGYTDDPGFLYGEQEMGSAMTCVATATATAYSMDFKPRGYGRNGGYKT